MSLFTYLKLGVKSFRRNIAAIAVSTIVPLGIFASFGIFVVAFQPDPSTVSIVAADAAVTESQLAELRSLIPGEHFTLVATEEDPDIALLLDEHRGIAVVAKPEVTAFTTGSIEDALQFQDYFLVSTTTPGVLPINYWARAMVALVVTLALTSATTVATETAEMRHTGALEQLLSLPAKPGNFFAYMFAGPLLLAMVVSTTALLIGLAGGLLEWSGIGAFIVPIPLIICFGLVGFILALKIRSTEATLGIMLAFLIVTMILSGVFLPVGLIPFVDSAKVLYPPTYMVDLLRQAWTPEQAEFPVFLSVAVSLASLATVGFMIRRSILNLLGGFHERQ